MASCIRNRPISRHLPQSLCFGPNLQFVPELETPATQSDAGAKIEGDFVCTTNRRK